MLRSNHIHTTYTINIIYNIIYNKVLNIKNLKLLNFSRPLPILISYFINQYLKKEIFQKIKIKNL
ncbi:hypothetical protein PFAG_01158 [Plasmodium falciparum Santa Lucia]|uniref:Uncharacterized protein n=2 Tax=Plasmodium falciparum TaxID=5833 RepID=W7FNU3_PLAFA|nr:hypothetical protein PFNF135_01284 [Plasmodium falciparum NF135/5.C10]EUT90799.1 hypothetical protein PFAG_01158 [Plasmodium falciparum Santa Lucia]